MDIEKFLPLARAYHWESTRGSAVYMTQPQKGGRLQTWTWAQAMDEARRLAAYFRAQGFEKGDHIAILTKNTPQFMITELACWMAGCVSVGLYPTVGADTVQYVIEHCDAKMIFVGKLDPIWAEQEKGIPEELPRVLFPEAPEARGTKWAEVMANNEPIQDSPLPSLEDTSLLIYTSGSTGQPKGVITTFAMQAFAAQGAQELFQITPNERMLSYLPLAHSFERMLVANGSYAHGYQVFFVEALDTFARDLKAARPTIFHSVPRLWLKFQQGVLSKMPEQKLRRLLRIPILNNIIRKKIQTGLGLDACRYAVSGSAPIPPELIQFYLDIGIELLEGYAMSENFAYSHCSMPGKARVGYVGNTFPMVEQRISEEGEIQVKSLSNTPGYYKNDEATAELYTDDGWLKTGDRGEIDSAGRLKITGRVKELFKTSKGKYIAPAPIENLLNAHAVVEQSCVTGSGEPQPHVVVMLAEDVRPTVNQPGVKERITAELEALLAEVNGQVEHHEQLAYIAVAKDTWEIENGFLTPTMKIKRSKLEDVYGPQTATWGSEKKKVIWEA